SDPPTPHTLPPSTDPAPTHFYTLSLHDALPIFVVGGEDRARHAARVFVHRRRERRRHDHLHRRGGRSPSPARLEVVVGRVGAHRSEEHTSELQSRENLVCRLLLAKKNKSHEQCG